MTAQEANGWLHYGGGLQLWRELYAPFGVSALRRRQHRGADGGLVQYRLNNREDLMD